MRRIIFLSIVIIPTIFSCLLHAEESQTYDLNGIDGPYLFYQDSLINVYSIEEQNKLSSHTALKNDSFRVIIPNKYHDEFWFTLQDGHDAYPSTYPAVEKIFAVSDIEGNFEAFVSLLQSNKLIDNDLNWIFQDGHLVLVGDLVDRGEYVTQCLWLIYKLEQEAERAGGKVHFLLGNHELMDLKGRIDYAQDKYVAAGQRISSIEDPEEALRYLFSNNSVLGNWLRSKNTIERMGNVLFVHAGLSSELLEAQYSIQQINDSMRTYLGLQNSEITTETGKLLFGRFGPVWFRGLVIDYKDYYTKTEESKLDEVLSSYNAETVVIGHTIVDSIVSTDYDGKVIRIDIHQPKERETGKAEALLIEGNEFFRVNDLGERFLLKKEN
ncbi:MAG: metallophosphoesterase [Candidatus Cloacimonetes bacterium]|nr:metallophosphoesterase [Candidatus Cloacimonadota bacterium]